MQYVLCHHGVKGMKWGVRRYQKADGTTMSFRERRQFNAQRRIEKAGGSKKKAITLKVVSSIVGGAAVMVGGNAAASIIRSIGDNPVTSIAAGAIRTGANAASAAIEAQGVVGIVDIARHKG